MKRKTGKRIFPLIALLLLAPWPVSYAYEASGTAGIGEEKVKVQVVAETTAPKAVVLRQAISEVQPGDLYFVDATDQSSDIVINLHITNTADLVRNYNYLILRIGVYARVNEASWVKARDNAGSEIAESFISLQNGSLSVTLPGRTIYKITIEGGSLHYINASGGEPISPLFYLRVN